MNVVGSIVIKATAVLAALLIMAVSVFLAGQVVNADPEDYDTNGNGILEKDEVLAVVIDYFRDRISKDDVLEVLVLYFLSSASPEPTPTPTPSPTPTPTATSTSSQEDVTAPELVELTLGSSEVDVSDGAGMIDVRVKASDDLSGIRSIQLEFGSPTGEQSEGRSAREPVAGTYKDGEYAIRLTLPQYSETGTWRLKYVWISDNVGNSREYRPGELTALGLVASFEVEAMQEDVTTPELVELTLGSSEVDVSDGAGMIDVRVKASDDLSGIRSIQLEFGSPTGEQSEGRSAREPVAGTYKDGEYAIRLTLPQYSETGTWRLKYVWISDNVGNSREYRPGELTALGLVASFEVEAMQEDVTTPELVELTLGSSEVDVSDGAGMIDVRVKASDDLSGIRSIQLEFGSPTGEQSEGRSARDPITGTSNEGEYALRLTLPQYSETGTWRLKYVWISDNVGNSREYRPGELTALGLVASFEVLE